MFVQILTVAYASVGVISAIGYWPTIKDIHFHKKPSANIKTYAVWTLTTGISLLYGIFILNDFLFRVIAGVGFVCCFTVLALSINLKYRKVSGEEESPSY